MKTKSLFNRQVSVPAIEPVQTEGSFIRDAFDFCYFADEKRNNVFILSSGNPKFLAYRGEQSFREGEKLKTVDGCIFRSQLQAHIEFCQSLLQDVEDVIAAESAIPVENKGRE